MSGQAIRKSATIIRDEARHEPQKERGLWNFLTWSFFMSQMLADGHFLGAASAARTNSDELTEDGSSSAAHDPAARGSLPDSLDGGDSDAASAAAARGDGAGPAALALNVEPGELSQFAAPQVADDGSAQAGPHGYAGGVASDARQAAAEQAGEGSSGAGAGLDGSCGCPGGVEAGPNPLDPGCPGVALPDIGLPIDPTDILPGIGGGVVDVIDTIVPPITEAIDTVVHSLTDTIGGAVTTLNATVDGLLVTVEDLLNGTTANVTDALDGLGTTLNGLIGDSAAQIDQTLSGLTASTSELLTGLTTAVEQATAPITTSLTTVVNTSTAQLGDTVSGLLDGVLSGGGENSLLMPVAEITGSAQGGENVVSGVVGSAGDLLFKPVAAATDLTDALFSGGAYTDYNQALQNAQAADTQSSGTSLAAGSSTLLDVLFGEADAPYDQADQDTPAPLPFAHLVEDIGLRGLSDGLGL